MRVLVACEESQRVTIAFREKGHQAFSCDIQDCSGGHREWHIKGDVIEHLQTVEPFYYDLIIAHPPCTYLSVATARNFTKFNSTLSCSEKIIRVQRAADFFMFFYNYPYCKRICIENPRAMKMAGLPHYSQVIQPYDFGDDYSKQTLLWLKGLPYLIPNVIELNRRSAAPSWVGTHRSAKERSKTFNGIAKAMAEQWDFK